MTYNAEPVAVENGLDGTRISVVDDARPRYTPAARKVVDAGVEMFAQVGFLATTIRDLTKSCGLTAATFYNHFESKEALLFEIVNAANAELDRRMDRLRLATLTGAEALSELVRALVIFNLIHPREARIANREWVFLQANQREQVTDHRRRVRGRFEQALHSPLTAGQLLVSTEQPVAAELEARLLAMSILNLSIASSEWYRAEGPLTVDDVADAHCRLALRMAGYPQLGAPGSAAPHVATR
jgi:AcrR family transcriptional regulator